MYYCMRLLNAQTAFWRQTGSVADFSFVQKQDRAGRSAVVAEDGVELLGDPDEGCPLGHFLDASGSDVGASRTQSAQDVQHGCVHVTSVGHLKYQRFG